MVGTENGYNLLHNLYIVILMFHTGIFTLIFVYFNYMNQRSSLSDDAEYAELMNKMSSKIKNLNTRVAWLEKWVDNYEEPIFHEIKGVELEISDTDDDTSNTDSFS